MTSQTMNQTTKNNLKAQLLKLGLRATAEQFDDLIARATRNQMPPHALLEEIAATELSERATRSLRRLLLQARIGRFKPISDFEWGWPLKIDRDLIERAFTLDFITEARNLILIGPNGLGKTMIAKNIAYRAVTAGYSVLFRTASDLLADLQSDSPQIRRRKFSYYARPRLLCIDELAYLSYDSNAADMIFEIVNRRYESGSILITTNRVFREWNVVFPNATCIATLLDRLTHHADITLVEGNSYRVRESEIESLARKKKTPTKGKGSNES